MFASIIETEKDEDESTISDPFLTSIQQRRSTVKSLQSLAQVFCRRIETTKASTSSSSFEMTYSHEFYDDRYESDPPTDANGTCTKTRNNAVIIRSLKPKEIDTLVQVCKCQCDDWNNVYVMISYTDGATGGESTDHSDVDIPENLSLQLEEQVQNCSFEGYVVLGIILNYCTISTTASLSVQNHISVEAALKPAIKNNMLIKNTIISPGARVYNNTLISDTFVGPQSSIINCGLVCIDSRKDTNDNDKPCFIDEMEIALGPESGGGRPIHIKPESTLVDVCISLGISQANVNGRDYQSRIMKMKPSPIETNVVLGHVKYTQRAINIYISESATVESCPSVVNAILLPESKITNSTVQSAFLQWKSSTIDSNISSTILMECSDIGPKSVVADTVIGPDSHVSCGEVHCSLIGPNTNSHHQSLVISALWPMGRGNVGYGSNIGSNHTGRLPDQECTVGEGIFWGLGCIIKYPVDLSRSYYSIVAAGVQLPPSTVSMPFSLIMNGSNKYTDANAGDRNEIVPGWLLQSSPYTILRSEEKFKKRRKAKRHDFYCDWRIIRPSIVDACIEAREALRKISALGVAQLTGQGTSSNVSSHHVYTKRNLIELGENYMTERGRKVGIEAYTTMIQRYAFRGLFDKMYKILDGGDVNQAVREVSILLLGHKTFGQTITSPSEINVPPKSWPIMPWQEESYNNIESVVNHQMHVLSRELEHLIEPKDLPLTTNVKVITILLKKMISLEQSYVVKVRKSKLRDDTRGSQIIPNYKEAHVHAMNDPVVKMAEARTNELVTKCKELISSLDLYEGITLNTPQSKL